MADRNQPPQEPTNDTTNRARSSTSVTPATAVNATDQGATPSTHNNATPSTDDNAATSRAPLLVALGIVLSRVSGIVREVALAGWLGATTIAAEAFSFALTVPKLMQNLLGEGALSASFIPVYSQLADTSPQAARRTAGAVFGLLAAIVAAIVLILMAAAEPIVAVLARGAGDQRSALIVDLLRVMAPGIGFIVFAAWCLGILNSHRDFFLSYVAPVLWNASIVIAVASWATRTDNPAELAQAAAWGVFIGGIAQFVVQLPRVLRVAGPITPSLDRSGAATKEVLRRFVPGVAGRGVVTLGAFSDLVLSMFLAVGALAVTAKAQTLLLMPISVFAVSIAAADLPELSRAASKSAAPTGQALRRLAQSTERIVFFLLFSTIAFVVGGRSLISALFERGAFTEDDTTVVWLTLAVFSLGLVASGLSRLMQNTGFAQGDVSGPAKIAAIRLVTAAAFGLLLMFPADRFQVEAFSFAQIESIALSPLPEATRDTENIHRLGAVGLAAGSSVAAWLEYALLRRRLGISSAFHIGRTLRRLAPGTVIATALMGVTGWFTRDMHGLVAAPLVIGPAGLLYVAAAVSSGSPTAKMLQRTLSARVQTKR